jgi:hypothetical protein
MYHKWHVLGTIYSNITPSDFLSANAGDNKAEPNPPLCPKDSKVERDGYRMFSCPGLLLRVLEQHGARCRDI